MRILMWLTIGFCAGCGAGIWFFGGSLLLACAVGSIIAGALLFFIGSASVKRKLISFLCVGCSLGMLWMSIYDHFLLSVPRSCNGQTTQLDIEVSDYGYLTARGAAADGKIELQGRTYSVKFYINSSEILKPGDRVQGEFKLRYTGIRGEETPTYHQGKGILLLAYPKDDPTILKADAVPGKYFAEQLRHSILNLLDETFPEDTLGFARALLLGDSNKLPLETDKAFQVSGIRHIIAVSGLHVSVLFTLIQAVLRRKRILSCVVGLPVLFLFAAVAGFTPSIVRACVMHAVMLLASLGKKEYDPPTSLSVAVLVILGLNPLALTSVSFQLSVGCIVGILLFSQKIIRYLRAKLIPKGFKDKSFRAKLLNWIIQSVAITLSTMVTTLPLSAYYFGSISLVSVITNLMTLWLVSVCFYGIVLSCLLGALLPVLAVALAWLVSWPMRLVCLLAKILASVPFAAVSVENVYVFAWLLFAYAMVITFFIMGRKQPLILCGCVVTSLVVCLSLSSLERLSENFRVSVLDVGQGQCVILQSGKDCYLVDCGGDYSETVGDMAAQNLRGQGINSVDGVILTHFDMDHTGGAESFMAQVYTANLYIPVAEDHNGMRAQLQADHGQIMRPVAMATTLSCGDGKITIFPSNEGTSGNESSLCILFQVENYDILITGDRNIAGENELLENYAIPDLEILIVGHHGSSSSTGVELLQKTMPNVAVISVGADNSYGHPAEETLQRLERFGCVVLRTDESGTITFRG